GEVLSWGGWSRTGAVLNRSQRYSANSNKWFGATADALDRREHLGWTTLGARLYMLGGRSDTGEPLADVAVYDIGTLGWSSLQSLPTGRYGSFSAHDGAGLFTWGGRDLDAAHADGLVMDGSLWTPIASDGAPSARWAPHRQSGWACALAGARVAVSGGQDVNGLGQRDGAVYSRADDAWTPLPAAGEMHEWGVGVCIDGTLVLWGGAHEGVASATGEKISP
ncbi:MAG TPA: kelch repeat-containing protein, partial [Polyangiaceae bacterium]|nr:kelch repeat-containing protein [Polyangiaceae bacterium]